GADVGPDNPAAALAYGILGLSWVIFVWSNWRQEREIARLKLAQGPEIRPYMTDLGDMDDMAESEDAMGSGNGAGHANIYAQEGVPVQIKTHPDLIAKLRATAEALAANGVEITSDDIHEVCPIPAGIDPRVMGAAFYPQDKWVRCGWQASRRKESHHRPVRI